jgi:hypothetical protein
MSCQPIVATLPVSEGTPKRRRRSPAKPRPLITRDRRDGRLAITKQFDEVVRPITADLGAVRLTTMQKALIDCFAGAQLKLDDLNARLKIGEDVNINEYTTAATTLVRLSQRLSVQTWEELKKMGESNE